MFGEPKKAAVGKMRKQALSTTRHVLFLATLVAATFAANAADAAKPKPETHEAAKHPAAKPAVPAAAKQRMGQPQAPKHSANAPAGAQRLAKSGKLRFASNTVSSGGGISCVPYARAASGITVKGNAANWWANAAGLYERGYRPETGSVLNFRATGRMRLGHVAVVTQVINAREVMIDHANWSGPGLRKGSVAKGVPVIDVSENNDWSAVRVALGDRDAFGSVYPTYGFIYDRPDSGTLVANAGARGGQRYEEVAEAPAQRRTPRR
jgi:surface antigen